MESIVFLTYFGVMLLVGLFASVLSSKVRIPKVLLLIMVGMIFGAIQYKDAPLITFPPIFLESFAILALVIVVFDSTFSFKLKEFDTFSSYALKLSLVFLLLTLALLSVFTYFIYYRYFPVCLVFAALMAGTAPGVTLTLMKDSKNKVVELLKVEALINTPIVVIVPFIVIEFIQDITGYDAATLLISQLAPFLTKIVAGIGAGLVVGIIVFKLLKRGVHSSYSSIGAITAAILAFILAENLGGNGVLAVTTMGLFVGNLVIKEKGTIVEFSSLFSNLMELLVFILIGLVINIPYTWEFFIKSMILFIVALLVRYYSVRLVLKDYDLKKQLFITLSNTKGIAVAVVIFLFSSLTDIPGIVEISNLSLAFMLYSIVLSSVVVRFSEFFLQTTVIPVGPKHVSVRKPVKKI